MEEVFPVLGGVLLGAVSVAWAWPWRFQPAAALVIGVFVTILSGEFTRSWVFALIDCGETAAAAWIVTALCRARPWRAFIGDGALQRRSVSRLPGLDSRGG